jgi:hypothetical protein
VIGVPISEIIADLSGRRVLTVTAQRRVNLVISLFWFSLFWFSLFLYLSLSPSLFLSHAVSLTLPFSLSLLLCLCMCPRVRVRVSIYLRP